jgi:Phage integrase family
MSGPLRLALRKHSISSNVAANLLAEEKPGRGSRRQYVLAPDEIASVLTACKTKIELALISLALYSGARQSELLGLRWADVDWDNYRVTIAGQVDKQGRWTERTKSKRRTVWIPPQVATNLKELWLASLLKEASDYVFAASPDRPRSQEWARKVWVRIRERAAVPDRVRMHDLRHTFASILIGRGASPVELACEWRCRRMPVCSTALRRRRSSARSLPRATRRLSGATPSDPKSDPGDDRGDRCAANPRGYTVAPRGCGGIGRRARFRSVWASARGGSSPLIRIAGRAPSVGLTAMRCPSPRDARGDSASSRCPRRPPRRA